MYKTSEPMFNFSEPLPVYGAGLLIVIEAAMLFLPAGLTNAVARFGILRPIGVGTLPEQIVTLFGHAFLHSGWSHVLMNSFLGIVFAIVMIRGAKVLATSKGKSISGTGAFLAIFFGGVVLGGLAQWIVWWLTNAPLGSSMLGASGGVSALFAAGGWAMGGRQKMLQFGLGWAAINVVLVFAGPMFFGSNISWAGHMGGYLAGMIIAPFFVRANSTGFSVLR